MLKMHTENAFVSFPNLKSKRGSDSFIHFEKSNSKTNEGDFENILL